MIDAHAHIFSGDIAKYPPFSPAGEIAPADFANPMDLDRLLGEMDGAGVSQAVLVQRGSIYGFDSSYVCTSAARYPDRLKAVCSIDASRADCAEQVEHWIKDRGAVGIRMMELVRDRGLDWLDSAIARDAWAAAAELDVPVCVHFFPWNRTAGLAALLDILKQFPQLTVVVDHLAAIKSDAGPPDHGVDDILEALAAFDGVNLKFTTIPLGRLDTAGIDAGPVIERIARRFGAERMLWGSDITQSQGSYDYMVKLGIDAVKAFPQREQDHLLGGTAARIYRFA